MTGQGRSSRAPGCLRNPFLSAVLMNSSQVPRDSLPQLWAGVSPELGHGPRYSPKPSLGRWVQRRPEFTRGVQGKVQPFWDVFSSPGALPCPCCTAPAAQAAVVPWQSHRTAQAGPSSWNKSCSAARGRRPLGKLVWNSGSGDLTELQGMVGAFSKAPWGPRICCAAQMQSPVLRTPRD